MRDPTLALPSPSANKPFSVSRDGFSLNAAVACEPHAREPLERLCRYLFRPPIAPERLSRDGDGLVVYELKRPFADGTTHVIFEPADFRRSRHPASRDISASMHVIARRAALLPRPRAHFSRYHGLFAANARHRHRIVPEPVAARQPPAPEELSSSPARTPSGWMQRLPRTFGIVLRRCPRCGGDLRVIATITDPRVIARILEHIEARQARPSTARDPPWANAARHGVPFPGLAARAPALVRISSD